MAILYLFPQTELEKYVLHEKECLNLIPQVALSLCYCLDLFGCEYMSTLQQRKTDPECS